MDLIDQIIPPEEGREHKAYPDPITKGAPWTIGIGHTGWNIHKGAVWSDAQIDAAYELDKKVAIRQCNRDFPWFSLLDDVRQAVIVSMMFQMGPPRLAKFVNTLKAVAHGDWDAAADGMLASRWATQTPARAKRHAAMMRTGIFVRHS